VDERDTKTIHCTRVAFKEFRYMVEALADCLPIATEHRLEAMHDYQTLMGDVQDAQVLLAAVDKFLCKRDFESGMSGPFRKELLKRRIVPNQAETGEMHNYGDWAKQPGAPASPVEVEIVRLG
jgi:CHAD domain-containing protein